MNGAVVYHLTRAHVRAVRAGHADSSATARTRPPDTEAAASPRFGSGPEPPLAREHDGLGA